jgi:sulfide:quinone oxidoreductase
MTTRPSAVLVAGGGVAALEAALALRDLAEERVSIELLAPEPRFWYRPLAVVEPFGMGNVHGIELTEVAEACGAEFILGALASVDADAHLALTNAGTELAYDALVVATGAKPVTAVAGALTFRGPADTEAFSSLLAACESGAVGHLVFAVPGGATWPLPLYELALLTAEALHTHRATVRLSLVTPEAKPLALFGGDASDAVGELLVERGIDLLPGRYPVAFANGVLECRPGDSIEADRVVALPRLRGAPVDGLPRDNEGFVPTDPHGRVADVDGVYAAGDATAFPIKQGGLAAQQALAVAEAIAARAGAPVEPQPFRPVLRGLLLTGTVPAYLRSDFRGPAVVESEPLWWPPAKIVGRHLAPFLAERAGLVLAEPESGTAISVNVDLRGQLPGSAGESARG